VLFGWHLREGVWASVAGSYSPDLIGLVVYLCGRRDGYPSSGGNARFSSGNVVYLPMRNLDADDCALYSYGDLYLIYINSK
jgi:hypothetical protein